MFNRRRFLQMAAAVPASTVLGHYNALAAPQRNKVKITAVKHMMVRGLREWNLIRVETDAGIAGIGEAYYGRGIKELISQIGALIVGNDPLDIDMLYTKMSRNAFNGYTSGMTFASSAR